MEVKRIEYLLSNDEKGLLQKLNIIAGVMKKGSENYKIRELALSVRKGTEDFDYNSELERIYNYVTQKINYRIDTRC